MRKREIETVSDREKMKERERERERERESERDKYGERVREIKKEQNYLLLFFSLL